MCERGAIRAFTPPRPRRVHASACRGASRSAASPPSAPRIAARRAVRRGGRRPRCDFCVRRPAVPRPHRLPALARARVLGARPAGAAVRAHDGRKRTASRRLGRHRLRHRHVQCQARAAAAGGGGRNVAARGGRRRPAARDRRRRPALGRRDRAARGGRRRRRPRPPLPALPRKRGLARAHEGARALSRGGAALAVEALLCEVRRRLAADPAPPAAAPR